MAVNKKKKRGPSLDDKFMGPEPLFTETDVCNDNTWTHAARWYNYYYKSKDYTPSILQFAQDHCGYNKKKVSVLKRVKDWKFLPINKKVKLLYRGFRYSEDELQSMRDFIEERYREGLTLKKIEEKKKQDTVVITPAERTRMKVMDTIYHDWDSTIVEGWFDGDFKQKFACYNRFKMHGLKGNAINIFKGLLEEEYQNISDAYNKTCEQCVEAYSHISKGDKRKMMKQFETVFEDLERLRDSFKATRTPRARKPKSSDAQVAKLQYCTEDIDAKLTSINPIMVPGKSKLFVYNRKNKKLIQYVTESTAGFEVSGTSIKNFDEKLSKQATLRKPDDILPQILNKTELQIEKVWDTITTKINKPTGRINSDCILMRVF